MAEVTFSCDACGAMVYPEHIQSGIARRQGGRLMCSYCLQDSAAADRHTADPHIELAEPVSFDDDEPAATSSSTIISAIGGAGGPGSPASAGGAIGAARWDETHFKRPLNPASAGATRCRVFHSKLNDGAIAFMTEQVNHWLDENKDVTVKFSTSTIGVFEGKHADPNLILTVFY